MFSNEEPEVPGSRVSIPADWSPERDVRPSEDLLSGLGALRSSMTVEMIRWGLLKVQEILKLRARYGS